MKLNQTDLLILRALSNTYGPQTVSEIYGAMPAGLFANKRTLSARLCEMRGRNLLTSKTLDSGINEWLVSESGQMAVAGQRNIQPDITTDAGIPVTEQNQPDSVDISADIPDPIAADFAAAIDADEVADAMLPPYDDSDSIHETIATGMEEFNALGTPICADLDEVDAAPEVAPDLVEEANSLRLRCPLPHEQNALFVLSVLIDVLGRGQPAMAYELARIAAYLEGETA